MRVSHAGYSFASKLEADLFDYLKLMEYAGEISDIATQTHIKLTRAGIVYVADFSALNLKTKEAEYFEAKGFETDVWKIKKSLWKYYGPGKLHIFYRQGKGLSNAETITPCYNEGYD